MEIAQNDRNCGEKEGGRRNIQHSTSNWGAGGLEIVLMYPSTLVSFAVTRRRPSTMLRIFDKGRKGEGMNEIAASRLLLAMTSERREDWGSGQR